MLTSFRFILRIVLYVKWSHFWNTGNVVDYCKSDFVQWRSDHNHFKGYISHYKAALVTSLVDSSDYFCVVKFVVAEMTFNPFRSIMTGAPVMDLRNLYTIMTGDTFNKPFNKQLSP